MYFVKIAKFDSLVILFRQEPTTAFVRQNEMYKQGGLLSQKR